MKVVEMMGDPGRPYGENNGMNIVFQQNKRPGHPLSAFRRLLKSRSGMGAVEFALIAPLLLMIYISAFEISIGMTVSRKVSRASNTIADLITQQTSVNKDYLATMLNVTESIVAPYKSAGFTLKITGIQVSGSGTATVAWSWNESGGTPYAKGSATTLPADLLTMETFIVRTELVVPHDLLLFMPGLQDSQIRTLNMSQTSYYRQRVGDEITCGNCT